MMCAWTRAKLAIVQSRGQLNGPPECCSSSTGGGGGGAAEGFGYAACRGRGLCRPDGRSRRGGAGGPCPRGPGCDAPMGPCPCRGAPCGACAPSCGAPCYACAPCSSCGASPPRAPGVGVDMLPRSPAVLPFSQVSRVHHDAVSPAASAATRRSCCSPWSGARHLRVVVGALELVGAPPGAKLPRVAAPSWAPLVLVRLLRQGPVPATLPMALELLPDVVDRLAEVRL